MAARKKKKRAPRNPFVVPSRRRKAGVHPDKRRKRDRKKAIREEQEVY